MIKIYDYCIKSKKNDERFLNNSCLPLIKYRNQDFVFFFPLCYVWICFYYTTIIDTSYTS